MVTSPKFHLFLIIYMPNNSIISNPVNIQVQISKVATGWEITPALIAFPALRKPNPKNIVFLLDNSGSMNQNGNGRLEKVKIAVTNLLDKLNTHDTFSIVSFNKKACIWVAGKQASQANIDQAKSQVQKIKATDETNFKAAFTAINTPEILPPQSRSNVIFLTDGADSYGCSADDLVALFLKQKLPRIIPIGVWLGSQNSLLNRLASLSYQGGKALYINSDSPTVYQNAFDEAFKQATEQSQSPASLEMTIQTKRQENSTQLIVTRKLNHILFDGSSETSTSLYLDSPTPPYSLKFRFQCDNTSLQAEHKLTSVEYKKIEQGERLDINIRGFKWKNNRTSSWILALGSAIVGLALITGLAVFTLSAPQFNLWLWQTLAKCIFAGLAGLSLFIYGALDILRKTYFLPTKQPAEIEIERARLSSMRQQGFFSQARSTIANLGLAASGAGIGYAAGTATSAANAVVATGISPSVFILGCSASGAIAMLLLAYGCTRLCNASSPAQPRIRI